VKNVLINCVSSGSGGALSYLKNLVPRLLQKCGENPDISVYLLVKRNQEHYFQEYLSYFNLVSCPDLSGYKRFIWEYLVLPKIVERHNIDLIFTPYQIARVFEGTRNIVMLRNMDPFTFHKYKSTFKNRLRNHALRAKTAQTVKESDKIVAVSQYVHDFLVQNELASTESIVKIYHGRDTNYSPEKELSDGSVLDSLGISDRYIFTCGSLFPYRKCEDVIRAFSLLEDSKLKLVVAGSGNDGRYKGLLERVITECGLDGRVLLLGHVAQSQMIVLYRNCAVFVSATECEACPNIAIEAMSSGCQIVSSNIMPLPEIFQDAASYYRAGDIEQMAAKIRDRLGQAATVNRRSVALANSFSWDSCADQTYALILNEVCGEG
jgi:glycosyltransferase involved in cell wall biosynthesis